MPRTTNEPLSRPFRRPFLCALATLCTLAATAAMAGMPASAAPAADPWQPKPYVQLQHAPWTRDATLYQINLRQFTPEGTLRAAQAQLPRLKSLGVGIVWLMPIHPIGQKNRKGPLGSPYAIRDFKAVNPEYGTMADFKAFVAEAHALGLHVILDWVGNHTAWDNALLAQHPQWYLHDANGQPRPTPWFDWDDIIDLDYSQPGLRRYMAEAMRFWVKEAGVDGYRCDAAGLIPLDFWEQVARELRAIKPVFMLAEWESRDLHAKAFDASYAWTWWDALRAITEGKADATSLYTWYAWNEKFYPKAAYRMLYTTNHDKNAWDGTEFEIFGPAVDAAITFSFVSDGMPLIYNGQETGNPKRLKFFERDPIEWKASPYEAMYRRLIALKKAHPALWNGEAGATMQQVGNDRPKQVFSFVRAQGGDRVLGVFNFSAAPVTVHLSGPLHAGRYRDHVSGDVVEVGVGQEMVMEAWGYRVLVK